jgi:hypothetical protein
MIYTAKLSAANTKIFIKILEKIAIFTWGFVLEGLPCWKNDIQVFRGLKGQKIGAVFVDNLICY